MLNIKIVGSSISRYERIIERGLKGKMVINLESLLL
jgi:hypothetical protein